MTETTAADTASPTETAPTGTAQPTATWEPPGPGSWVCERSHASKSPTPVYRRIVSTHTKEVYRKVLQQYGAPAGTIDMQFVNGALYRRLVPLFAPNLDKGKTPPNAVVWVLARIHPEFRRREKVAADSLENETFLDDVRTWMSSERFEWIERNKELQAVAVDQLDDGALAEHLRLLDLRLVEGWHRHHELHGNDLGPIGDLLAHAVSWGIDTTEAMGLLKGSSPATTDAARHGRIIADALRDGGVDPSSITSVDAIRAVPEAADALDAYLDVFGWRLISDYDIAGLTLHELPGAIVAIVKAGAGVGAGTEASEDTASDSDRGMEEAEARLRAKAGDAALFDRLLSAAREGYGVRDDNGPLTWAWPAGLTRRAYLEAGARLHGRGRIVRAEDVFELDIDELALALNGSASPTADELTARAAKREWEASLDAPDLLGPPPADPDVTPLPPAMRRMMGIVMAAATMIDPERDDTPGEPKNAGTTEPATGDTAGAGRRPLTGLGIGSNTYRGIARLADDPARAIEQMQPGDVLVAPWTAPSFNAVLAIAGGVVVQEGGLLCHAAVMARELGIPAVIGCADAMTEIADGATVEVDPVAGCVTVIPA